MKSTLLLFFLLFFGTFQLSANSYIPKEVKSNDPIEVSWGDPLINIYPNPTTDYFSVSNINESVTQIDIFNILGRKLDSFEINSDNRYFISDYPKGMYLVQFIARNKVMKTIRLNKR